jgi:hypothetical protein
VTGEGHHVDRKPLDTVPVVDVEGAASTLADATQLGSSDEAQP